MNVQFLFDKSDEYCIIPGAPSGVNPLDTTDVTHHSPLTKHDTYKGRCWV